MWLDEILTTIFFVVLLINIQEQHQSSEAEAAVHTQTQEVLITRKQKNDELL